MLLNLNEQEELANRKKNRKNFFSTLLINFILFSIIFISISSKWDNDSSLLDESRKVYSENQALKEFISNKFLEFEEKNDSIFNLGLNISSQNVYYSSVNSFDNETLNEMIANNLNTMVLIEAELIPKWDSIQNVPVFMPIAPTDLDRISDHYGWRKHPIHKRWVYHNGIDIVAKHKADILATSDGIIIKKIKSKYGYGNRIVIDHGNGFKTLYAHLNGFNVNMGDVVNRGDIIGYMGSTGLSTGTHLHYEILKGGRTVNPIDYLYDLAKK